MAEFPAFPLWTDAYLADTTHLTTIEHGAYLLLLIVCWRAKENRLPDDDRQLARYAGCSPAQWKRLRPVMEPFFQVEKGFWTQGRLTDEAVAVRQKKEKAARAGRASALKRKGRHLTGVGSKLKPSSNKTPTQDQHYHNHITDTNVSGADAPTDDDRKRAYDGAKRLLRKAGDGMSASAAGAIVTKWLKQHTVADLLAVLPGAEDAAHPASWITKALQERVTSRSSGIDFTSREAERYRQMEAARAQRSESGQ